MSGRIKIIASTLPLTGPAGGNGGAVATGLRERELGGTVFAGADCKVEIESGPGFQPTRGIANPASICYINAMFHCLMVLPNFRFHLTGKVLPLAIREHREEWVVNFYQLLQRLDHVSGSGQFRRQSDQRDLPLEAGDALVQALQAWCC